MTAAVCVLMDSGRESILKVGRERGVEERGTEGSSWPFVVGMDRGEGGEKKREERRGAINFATDEGHKGAEVLQRSWELFLHFCSCTSLQNVRTLFQRRHVCLFQEKKCTFLLQC